MEDLPGRFSVVPLSTDLREKVLPVIESSWGSVYVAVNGNLWDCRELPGFAALGPGGELLGYLLYVFHGGECEIMALESVHMEVGVGSALVDAVRRAARKEGAARVIVATTNDNTHAIRFYQRRGFRLRDVRLGAMDAARKVKPVIPLLGEDGIELRDELEFESASGIILVTERLILREMTHDDLPDLREIMQDWSEQATAAGLEKQLASYREYGYGRWAAALKGTGKVVGMCGPLWWDAAGQRVLELGYSFHPSYRRAGYAAEAARACIRYLFRVPGFDEVFSLMRDTNLTSMNVAIRCGMLVRGRYTEQSDGEERLQYIFSVRRDGR